MNKDIETLNKEIIVPAKPDTPDLVYVVIEEPHSEDRHRLEPYVRLKSLPQDLMRLVMCHTQASNISEKVMAVMPELGRAQPSHYPSGIVELQWKLDDGSIFGLILKGFTSKLIETDGKLSVNQRGKITWRFHGPKQNPQHGEFADVEELMDFVSKSFVSRE